MVRYGDEVCWIRGPVGDSNWLLETLDGTSLIDAPNDALVPVEMAELVEGVGAERVAEVLRLDVE